MLGRLDVVRAFISASPGIQKTKGPHSITLMKHAMAGGALSKPVVEYLKSVGDADNATVEPPLTSEELTALTGAYVFGSAADERFDITLVKDHLNITRPGHTARTLIHVGSLEFYPGGAEAVRIAFKVSASAATLTLRDPDVVLVARRRV